MPEYRKKRTIIPGVRVDVRDPYTVARTYRGTVFKVDPLPDRINGDESWNDFVDSYHCYIILDELVSHEQFRGRVWRSKIGDVEAIRPFTRYALCPRCGLPFATSPTTKTVMCHTHVDGIYRSPDSDMELFACRNNLSAEEIDTVRLARMKYEFMSDRVKQGTDTTATAFKQHIIVPRSGRLQYSALQDPGSWDVS